MVAKNKSEKKWHKPSRVTYQQTLAAEIKVHSLGDLALGVKVVQGHANKVLRLDVLNVK